MAEPTLREAAAALLGVNDANPCPGDCIGPHDRDDCPFREAEDALRAALAALRAERDALEERMRVILHAGPSTVLATSVFDRAIRAESERDAAYAAVGEVRAVLRKALDGYIDDLTDAAKQVVAERDAARSALAVAEGEVERLTEDNRRLTMNCATLNDAITAGQAGKDAP